ncbi:MAG TPA: acid resistance serine protease MarP [Mycobacterium sp.]|nr:acid resistance serine protease MarP [Mycobacterium sp.]
MTASQWFDLAVIAVAFIFGVSGWRSGALGSLMSFVGVVLGGVAGVLLAPHIVDHISGPRTKLFIALFLILGLVVIGEVAGVVLGHAVRGAIPHGALRTVDSAVGVLIMVVAVLIVAWLLASPLRSSDQAALAQAFEGSMIRKEVDKVAPTWLRTVPNRLSALFNDSGIADVWPTFGRTPIVPVEAPDANLANSAVVTAARPSVVKIRGLANGCQKVLEGTGFVVKQGRVMSNAHVVAGADSVTVESDGTTYDAKVVSYDPNADISILEVPGLQASPLAFVDGQVKSGTDALVLGYPGGGSFVATPARIREVIELNGPDIYRTTTVTREVYTIRGTVRQGDSGGPLIDLDGRVLGVVFGAAVDDPDTGFVLTANEVAHQMEKVNSTEAVGTGPCIT